MVNIAITVIQADTGRAVEANRLKSDICMNRKFKIKFSLGSGPFQETVIQVNGGQIQAEQLIKSVYAGVRIISVAETH
jgi:hypothetical protein